MPIETRRVNFNEEIERLEGEIDDIAGTVADLDPTSARAESLEARGNRLETHRRGLEWARSEWDVDRVELGGLNAGEYGKMQDKLPDDAGEGATRVYYVAAGTSDAPYAADDLEDAVANVAQLSIAYTRWAEAQINELTSVGETGNRFYDSLREKRTKATSTETSGPSTSSP